MKKNEGTIDRIIRIVVGALFLILFFANIISGTLGIILLILSAILIFTGAIGFCPLYYLLKINTLCEKK